jgi:ACS family sodium-dependent inorganic phosphate cotransporter-like MFS transporter 5
MSSLWAYWAPAHERSRLVGIANAGSQIGNVVAFSLGGYLCINGFAGGWPSIFYIFGIVGIVWTVLWYIIAAKSPEEHRFISGEEKEYIKAHTNPRSKNDKRVSSK